MNPLQTRITEASIELKAAREDGSCERIREAAQKLDELLDDLKVPESS